MNFRIFAATAIVFSMLFTACSSDDEVITPIDPVDGTEDIVVTDNITTDTEWCDNVYVLGGRIAVEAGATLTICPGANIKGQAGTGVNATALLIARGATIMAEGTADAPIIFTSVADEITPDDIAAGNFASPNLDADINGLWGGVIVLGNATISASNDNDEDVSEVQIEGIPSSDANGLYGGNNDEDNSGVIVKATVSAVQSNSLLELTVTEGFTNNVGPAQFLGYKDISSNKSFLFL